MMLPRRAVLGGLAALPAVAGAETPWPTRPVRIVVPFAAGGSGDITSRLIGRALQQATGQPFIVENMAGGSGVVGTLAVLNAPADGYTLLLGTTTTLSANGWLLKRPPYDADRDFSLAAVLGITASFLVVAADSPIRSVQQLIAEIRANPGRMNSGWFNGSSRIPAALLKRQARLDFEEVAYRDVGNAVTDLRTGRIQFFFIDMVAADPHLQAGSIRALAITMPQRLPRYAELPAMMELYEGFDMTGFFGIAVRSGVPAPIQAEINRRVVAAVATPEVTQRVREMSMEPSAFDLEQARTYDRAERAKWGRTIRLAEIEPE
jgi:tripartite-type tricarboxylate transporter receptor subunit TctC